MRNIDFTNGEYYHIYNRGVDKRDVFLDDDDRWKFFDCLRDFNNKTYYEDRLEVLGLSKHSIREFHSEDFKRLGEFLKEQERVVNLVSYNEIKNHYHLIAQQLQDDGISNLMHKLGLSYTGCFNKKNNRSGALFQGTYKAAHIQNDDHFLWVLGYVNGNIEIHGLGAASTYPWSSYQAICKELDGVPQRSNLSALSGLEIIKAHFEDSKQFEELVQRVIKESRAQKEMMKKYSLDS